MPPPCSCGRLKMLNCLVSRSWPCQSIWDVALEERGSEPTWLSSRWCCPSSQRFQYDYVAQTHLHTTPSDCTSVSDVSSFVCQHRWLACFSHQTDLYSGALFVQVCLGWNLYLSTVLMLVVTALYTIAGRYESALQFALFCSFKEFQQFWWTLILIFYYANRNPRDKHIAYFGT